MKPDMRSKTLIPMEAEITGKFRRSLTSHEVKPAFSSGCLDVNKCRAALFQRVGAAHVRWDLADNSICGDESQLSAKADMMKFSVHRLL